MSCIPMLHRSSPPPFSEIELEDVKDSVSLILNGDSPKLLFDDDDEEDEPFSIPSFPALSREASNDTYSGSTEIMSDVDSCSSPMSKQETYRKTGFFNECSNDSYSGSTEIDDSVLSPQLLEQEAPLNLCTRPVVGL